MASNASSTQLAILAVALIAISAFSVAAARPCKTMLVSSYAFSLRTRPHELAGRVVTVFTGFIDEDSDEDSEPSLGLLIRPIGPHQRTHRFRREFRPVAASATTSSVPAYDLSSLRDRTKDILSVVVALLFGIGCGALTAATLYLAWSLFAAPKGFGDEDFDSSDEEDEIPSPKKVGYVMIPAAAATAEESTKTVV